MIPVWVSDDNPMGRQFSAASRFNSDSSCEDVLQEMTRYCRMRKTVAEGQHAVASRKKKGGSQAPALLTFCSGRDRKPL